MVSASWLLADNPMAEDDSPEHQTQNRRIQIVLQPNLADLPSLDHVKVAP